MVIYRVPLGKSIVTPPRPARPAAAPVAAEDNIPVLSWLALRGRCRACQAPISVRYPVVEALTAVLFALTAVRLGASWSLPAELAFVGGLIALAAVDLERFLLPRAILYPTLGLVGRRAARRRRRPPAVEPAGDRGRLRAGRLRSSSSSSTSPGRPGSASATSAWPACSAWRWAGWDPWYLAHRLHGRQPGRARPSGSA